MHNFCQQQVQNLFYRYLLANVFFLPFKEWEKLNIFRAIQQRRNCVGALFYLKRKTLN